MSEGLTGMGTGVGAAAGITLALLVSLVAVGIGGPRLLAAARPHLNLRPRLAIATVGTAGLLWVFALVAVGPALTWTVAGPSWMPGAAGEVCQRCLAAANPFSAEPLSLGVPSVVLLASSALVLLAVAVSVLREFRVRQPQTCRDLVGEASENRVLWGDQVCVVEDLTPFAYAAPRRCGGIYVSRGALEVLEAAELRAVLAHESAHLCQHHHLIAALAVGIAAPLRWVPFIRASEETLKEYLEIAADAHAMRVTGRTALVSALVSLQTAAPEAPLRGAVGAPHGTAAGTSPSASPSARVVSLLGGGGRPRRLPTVRFAALLAPPTLLGAGVHVLGAAALLTGCAAG